MSPKKSAAAKKSVPVEPPAKAPLRLVGEAKKSRVEPLAGAPQPRKSLSGAGEDRKSVV